jgi:lipoprotein signal peptidase
MLQIRNTLIALVVQPQINDGIRFSILKNQQLFLLLLSFAPPHAPNKTVSLAKWPNNHPLLQKETLVALGQNMLDEWISVINSGKMHVFNFSSNLGIAFTFVSFEVLPCYLHVA